jgi:hypothetical protein
MAERTAWQNVAAEIHRMGGWYEDQRTVDALRPVIDRYAAASGYAPAGPTTFAPSEQPAADLQATLDAVVKELAQVEQARDDFQAESLNKDNLIEQLKSGRMSWMNKTQELDAKREALLQENAQLDHQVTELADALKVCLAERSKVASQHDLQLLKDTKLKESLEQLRRGEVKPALTLEEEEAMLEPTNPGDILDQVWDAAERAEKAANEAADRAADAILKALRAAEPGAYRISSEGGVWLRVGTLADEDETFPEICELPHLTITEEDDCEQQRITAQQSERIRTAAVESAAPLKPFIPAGMKRCSYCLDIKPLEKFRKDSSKTSGYRSQCKECQAGPAGAAVKTVSTVTAEQPEIRTVSAGTLSLSEKTCNECAETKPVEKFSKDAKSSGGIKAKCKECCAKRDALNARRKREAQG